MIDIGVTFGLLAFIFYQWSNLTSKEIREIYARKPSFIPAWLFGPVWTLLYVGIFFAGYYAFTSPQDNVYFVSMLVLFIINIFLNKYWMVAFFDNENVPMALVIIFFLDATAIVITVLMGLSELYLSMGLFIAYSVWLIVATILNCQWWCVGSSKEEADILPTQMRVPIMPNRRVPPKMPRRGLVKHL